MYYVYFVFQQYAVSLCATANRCCLFFFRFPTETGTETEFTLKRAKIKNKCEVHRVNIQNIIRDWTTMRRQQIIRP